MSNSLTKNDEQQALDISKVWGKGPHIFKGVLKNHVFEPTDFFNALVATANAMSNGLPEPYGRANVNGRLAATHEIPLFFPEPTTTTFQQYETQVERSFSKQEYSIILDRVDVALPQMRTRVSPLLHHLFDQVGYPVRGIHSCIYAGNYGSTPFGIHVDDCHVLMASSIGSKKMAFWQRSYFEGRKDYMVPGSMAHISQQADKFINDAEVFELEPNDLLYWPPGYWHVGMSDSGKFHASLSVGIYHQGDAAEVFRKYVPLPPVAPPNSGHRALDSLDLSGLHMEKAEHYTPRVPERFGTLWDGLRSHLNVEHAAEVAFTSHALSMLTSAGFGPLEKLHIPPITPEISIDTNAGHGVQWAQIGNLAVVSANGLAFTFHSHANEVIALLSKIKQQGQVKVSDLLDRVPAERKADLWTFLINGRMVAPGCL